MGHLVCPRVLVVDDQVLFGRQLKGLLLDKGSIGALFVESLGEAADLLENNEYQFDAVLTDWEFKSGDDPNRKLYDGLDLVEYAKIHAPNVEAYVVTAHAENTGFKTKAAVVGFDLSKMFEKRKIRLTDQDEKAGHARQPWNKVRSDILLSRIGAADPALANELRLQAAGMSDDDLVGKVLEKTLPPTITYIQEMGKIFHVIQPIEVVCTPAADGSVMASAPKLGILLGASGDTPSAAIEALREVIAAHAEDLFAKQDSDLLDFAKVVKDRISRHLERP